MPAVSTKAPILPKRDGPDPNAAVLAYLSDYCADTRELNYAVLLAGPWGAGKTFFLREFLDRRNEPHLYVSLYGVRSVSDIEDQIFRQLHPWLSSKAAKLGGLVLKAVAKGALKMDFNGGEASLEAGLPDIKLKDFTDNPKGRLLVFDDLERASMRPSDVLGYINAFVEHENIKAIIVANETELDRNNAKFKRIKEKLIGQTLVVTPSVRSVMPALRRLLADSWATQFVERHEDVVLDVFLRSGTHNLRVLKQALWDFEKFARTLRTTDRDYEEALLKIMAALLALSIEVRVGRLVEADINEVAGLRWRGLLGKAGNPPTALDEAVARYEGIDLRQPYVDPQLIADLLFRGWIDASELARSLDRQTPFISADQEPAWRRAWYAYRQSDEAYEQALESVQADFDGRVIVHAHTFFHMFGVMLRAARIGAIARTPSQVVKACQLYIDDLVRDGRLEIPSISQEHWIDDNAEGLEYVEVKSPEFKRLRTYYDRVISRSRIANLPKEAEALLALMGQDVTAFVAAICQGETRSAYWRTPILHVLDPALFADALLNLDPQDQYRVLSALNRRYTTGQEPPGLSAEKSWLMHVHSVLQERRKAMKPMSKARLGGWLDNEIGPLIAPAKVATPAAPKPVKPRPNAKAKRKSGGAI